MDRGLVPPCLELDDTAEHRLLTWASRRTNKDGLVLLRPDKVAYRTGREVDGLGTQTFTHLEDDGWIEKVRAGESFRWKVLVPCSCAPEIMFKPPQAAGSVATVASHRSGATGYGFGDIRSEAGLRVKSESVRKLRPTNQLAQDFPELVRAAGIQVTPLQTNYPALASHLRRWHEAGVSINDIRMLMEEFVKHPEWVRRSSKPPWQVFVGRRDQLASLVARQQRRDPGNRKFLTDDHWTYHPRRSFSTA